MTTANKPLLNIFWMFKSLTLRLIIEQIDGSTEFDNYLKINSKINEIG